MSRARILAEVRCFCCRIRYVKREGNRKIGAKSLNSNLLNQEKLVAGSPNPRGKKGNPFALAPLTFDQGLRKILAAAPEPKAAKKTPSKKRSRKR